MKLLQSIPFFLLAALVSCSNNRAAAVDGAANLSWQYFTLRLEDSCLVIGDMMSDSIEIKKIDGETAYYNVGKKGRDSLLSWCNNLLNYMQPKLIMTCTDYVGKLTVRIKYSETLTKEVKFTSICNWKKLTPETQKIDSLLTFAVKP